MFGRRGSVAVIPVTIGTIVALLAGEFALATRLPGPPAVVACRDYTSWSIFSATGVGPDAAASILSDESALDTACRSVLAAG